MQVFSKINLDLLRPAVQVIVHAKQNDKAARFVQANLWQGEQPFAPVDVLAVFRAAKPDGTATFYDTNEAGDPAIVIDGNIATIELVEQVLTVPGDVSAELNLYTADGEKLTSFTFTIRVQASVLNDAEISSSDYFNVLTSTLTQAQAAADGAEQAANRAEAAADRAEDLSGGSVKSVNGQTPDAAGAVSIDVGVLSVNNQTPDENGDVVIDLPSGTGIRPNLLDNWYFGNPVNQRGQTSYTANGYMIDRWYNIGCSYDVGTQVLTNSVNYNSMIRQLIENASLYAGQKMTLSVLVENVSGTCTAAVNGADQVNPVGSSFGYVNLQNGLNTVTFTAPSTITNAYLCFSISTYVGASVKIIAAKLELGEGQTLAYQDGNGNWVLNEIPDYVEALAKCQWYFRRRSAKTSYGTFGLGTAVTSTEMHIEVPHTPMRIQPAIIATGDYQLHGTNAVLSPNLSDITVDQISDFFIRLRIVVTGAVEGQAYRLRARDDVNAYIDENADL